jgi:phosphatidylinositol alpha-1,6-mannosyltransferase
MRILFITRSLQPHWGGMQTQAATFIASLRKQPNVDLFVVGHSGSRTGLPAFFLRSIFSALTAPTNVLHLGDAALSPLLPIVAIVCPRLRRTITIHGLDIVWNFPGYRTVIGFCLRFTHKIAAVSHATKDACIVLGIPADRIVVIPCGIKMPAIVDRKVPDVPTILFVGRSVKRKGIVWFSEKVFPILKSRIPGIRLIIANSISEEKKEELFRSSSLLIMPNIPVKGDMEGFGITAIEAASRELPVVAARLEGLKDSVIENVTGEFFTPLDPIDAAHVIESALKKEWNIDPMRAAIKKYFDSDHIASRYVHELF